MGFRMPAVGAGLGRPAAGMLLFWAALAVGGCHGSGRVELAALNFHDIDPPPARVLPVELQCCYWWLDDKGQVWIAMERDQPLLLGPERFVYQLSLVLEKAPAGRARNYVVSQRELRGVARFGPAESRFVSLAGVVALYREPGNRLRGSFRLDVGRQSLQMLGGWSGVSRYLMVGSFVAVPDEQAGRRIAAATEAHGWDRQPPPTTTPAPEPDSQPAAPGDIEKETTARPG